MATADPRRSPGLLHRCPSQPLSSLRAAAYSRVCRLLNCVGVGILVPSPSARLTRHFATPGGDGSRHRSKLHFLPRGCPLPKLRPVRSGASGRRRAGAALSRKGLPDTPLSPLLRAVISGAERRLVPLVAEWISQTP